MSTWYDEAGWTPPNPRTPVWSGSPGPGHNPPGYGPVPGYRHRAALVFAFVFAPVGPILGIMSRKQIRRTGEEGEGSALARLIVGGIFTAIYVLVIVICFIAVATLASGSFGP